MSIYSGFATRFQEEAYDHCIDSILYVLQKRIIKFYQGEDADQEKFISVVIKLHNQMRNMEKSKYLEPKSSKSLSELVKFMQIYSQNISMSNQKQFSHPSEKAIWNSIEPLKTVEERVQQKKKVTLWVQKGSKIEQKNQQQKQQKEQEIAQKNNAKQQTQIQKQEDKQIQFKRTALTNNVIHGVNAKNTSRNHLSRDKQQNLLIAIQAKEKNRSISGMLNQKQSTVYSKVSFKHYQEQGSNTRRRKIKSINKSSNQIQPQSYGNKNEVSDIIKEYITKSKRSKQVPSKTSRHQLDYLEKLNDF